jgi:hypothetical protein
MSMTTTKLLTEFLTDFAMVPALFPLAAQKRHFPFAVALVQLLATIMYNLCDALGFRGLFLEKVHWHQISDVLTLTYVLHVLVHLQQLDEEAAAILRYLAFFLAWIF